MVNSKIDIFEISHEEKYFKLLENLEKIKHTNGSGLATPPIDSKQRVAVTSSVGRILSNLRLPIWVITFVTITTTTWLIAEQFPDLYSRKTTRLDLKPKLELERSLWPLPLYFSKYLMRSKVI
jgi:hypothetical protein